MTLSKPTILVLGATGKVGREAVRLLTEADDAHIVVGVRFSKGEASPTPEKAQSLQAQGIEVRSLDLDRQETLAPALKNVNRALLLTGYSVDMLKQSKAFIDTARQAGVEHIVHIGASGAPTNEVAHWGWHQLIEAYIEQQGFSYTHLRPEAYMQNLTAFGWLKDGVITHYIDQTRWSWVDCDDVAQVVAETLRYPDRHAGKIYPLGYEAASIQDVADILTEVVGVPFRQKSQPPEVFLETMLQAGADPTYMNCIYTQFKLNIANAIPNADATFDNFEAITGRKPTLWKEFALKHRDEFHY